MLRLLGEGNLKCTEKRGDGKEGIGDGWINGTKGAMDDKGGKDERGDDGDPTERETGQEHE